MTIVSPKLGSALLAAGFSGLFFACAGTPSPHGNAAMDDGPNEQCEFATPCLCADGRTGKTACVDDVVSCSCESCPAFAPRPAPPFDACGGEPFGTWLLQAIGTDGVSLKLVGLLSDDVTRCPAVLTTPAVTPNVRFDLRDGGALEFVTDGASSTLQVLDSCVMAKANCGSIAASGGRCSKEGCGVCSCPLYGIAGQRQGTWTRSSSTLSFWLDGVNTPASSDYCVKGEQMNLRDESGALFTYQRVLKSGAPTACAARAPDECSKGRGCHVGACTGGTKCLDAITPGTCTNRMGCTWANDVCSGTAPPACDLAEFDEVPGCRFESQTTAKCAGVPKPCSQATEQECKATKGCEAAFGCAGDGTIDCSQFTGACGVCNAIRGCSCASSGECSGSPTCDMQPDANLCGQAANCTWSASLCKGNAAACETLSIEQCAAMPGCHLDAGR
ncbi:MAG TPA: hypothetical protein VJT73_07695 [Polyangiaceae bacterium]|nr:hypothetical protein [Polyangiaceae bacterium]